MADVNDMDLLREYADRKTEAAFAGLVRQHLNLVHSVALRITGNAADAQDVAQAVFVILAQKAAILRKRTTLTGWLYETTRLVARQNLRTRTRQQTRDQEAYMQSTVNELDPEGTWKQLAPMLEAGMSRLNEAERTLLAMRFFENKSAAETAALLGIQEWAAHKRANRAVEKLRTYFTRHGVVLTSTGLATTLSANSIQAAPVGLAATIVTATLAHTAVTTTSVIAATKTIAMTTLQKILVTATVAVLAGAGIYEAHQVGQLHDQNLALQQSQASLADELGQVRRERDDARNRLPGLLAEKNRFKPDSDHVELLKLRGEVTRLKAATNDLPDAATKNWLNKIISLKQRLSEMPDKAIPELQFVTEKDWGNAAWNADLDSDDGVREALEKLREAAQNTFLNDMMKAAIKKYLAANDGVLPPDLTRLKPYFDVPVSDEILQRYALVQSGKPDIHEKLVETIAPPVDDEYDSYHQISINGAGGAGVNLVSQQVSAALSAFRQANSGQTPTEASQLLPFLKQSADLAKIQKYLDKFAADSNH